MLTKLRIKIKFNDLILNNLWEADLMKNNKVVAEILNEARGELILEEFIRSIKDCWSKYELELVRYANKCRLIRGWDDLFTQIDEHMEQSLDQSNSHDFESLKVKPNLVTRLTRVKKDET